MSAILSADDLNDFISPGVACIKPVETLPLQRPQDSSNAYEVTTEDKLPVEAPPPAQITLTDCLACSGCVTSAEAVLISLQSQEEVLHTLNATPPTPPERLRRQDPNRGGYSGATENHNSEILGKVFVASVSPQVRASLAATYGTSEQEAGWMIEQLLSGPQGLRSGGKYGNDFSWVVDTNAMREVGLILGAAEVSTSLGSLNTKTTRGTEGDAMTRPKKPILTSACPGWICYAEKTHPHILPHLSRLKSPQALTGTLLKTILSKSFDIDPAQIWHLAIMPCFDKKLEASREELTDKYWRPRPPSSSSAPLAPIRDVDCVITARELLMLAESRGISFPAISRRPLDPSSRIPFPDKKLDAFLFPQHKPLDRRWNTGGRRQPPEPAAGSSGGFLYHILRTQQALHPGSAIHSIRGRNADVIEYTLVKPRPSGTKIGRDGNNEEVLFRAARYYGFRNIQNLVRKLKPAKQSRMAGARPGGIRKMTGKEDPSVGMDYAYVEVMACPGGCTNGGGQIKVEDVGSLQGVRKEGEAQKQWLARVDEAYFSSTDDDTASSGVDVDEEGDVTMDEAAEDDVINGISTRYVNGILEHWAVFTGLELDRLVRTSYRAVESDVGKEKGRETERVVELAGKIGGGW